MEQNKDSSPKEEIANIDEDHLPKDLRKVIEFIKNPEEKKEAFEILTSEITFSRTIIGPLPCAEQMSLYESTLPGSADRIISLAETQQKHRIEMEKLEFPVRSQQYKRGQHLSFVIGVLGLGVTSLLALTGHDWVAGVVASVTIGTILACFIRRKSQDQE